LVSESEPEMNRIFAKPLAALVVVAIASLPASTAVQATIQDESCWEPDIEYPVPCDDEE
jgi:hypothetical protein